MLFGQQPDAKALVIKSIQNYDRDWRAGMQWGYTQTDVVRNGADKTVELSEIVPVEGTPYERLIARNGKPLSSDEKRKEDEKYQKVVRERQNESEADRNARIRKYENERSFLKDLPNAYDYKLLGEDMVDGRPSWIVSVTPRADFVPTTPRGSMLKHIGGKLWIDKQEIHWAKAEAQVIDPINIGWVLARIGPGAKIALDMIRVADGLWMPEKIDVDGTARVLMVHNKVLDEHLSFTGYKKVNSDSTQQASVAPRSSSFR